MFCMGCKNDLSQCTCPDLEERLDDTVLKGRFAYRRCKKCEKHYARCKCEDPEWEIIDQPKGTGN